MSKEREEALNIATKICVKGRFEAEADAVEELGLQIAAALLEARADGLSRAMFVPFPHNEIYEEAKRLLVEAAALRENM